MSLAEELLALERGFWLVTDREGFYRQHLADPALLVFHLGVMDRAETLASVGQAAAWAELDCSETRIVEPTTGAALLVYRADARREGANPYSAYCSSLYA